jgi:hypothetical protein
VCDALGVYWPGPAAASSLSSSSSSGGEGAGEEGGGRLVTSLELLYGQAAVLDVFLRRTAARVARRSRGAFPVAGPLPAASSRTSSASAGPADARLRAASPRRLSVADGSGGSGGGDSSGAGRVVFRRWEELRAAGGEGGVLWAELKPPERAMEKLMRCYGWQVDRLLDCCRQV